MRITALVENRPEHGLKAVHGLSLYIETTGHKLLFDLGPDETLFDNAVALGIDLTAVDTVILSHGHRDHGGALKAFLDANHTARVYVQRRAFEPHYSGVSPDRHDISLDRALVSDSRICLLDGDQPIDGELSVFTVSGEEKCHSPANDALYDKNGRDRFAHEQSLLIRDGKTALIMGCGHTGVVNILEKARPYAPELCVGGYHLFNPRTKETVPEELLSRIALEMSRYPDICFYTCHCTGEEAFRYLSDHAPNMRYLACGDSVSL